MKRRGFLLGLGAALATPAIVRSASIYVPPPRLAWPWVGSLHGHVWIPPGTYDLTEAIRVPSRCRSWRISDSEFRTGASWLAIDGTGRACGVVSNVVVTSSPSPAQGLLSVLRWDLSAS